MSDNIFQQKEILVVARHYW